jgi:acyl dehydratase
MARAPAIASLAELREGETLPVIEMEIDRLQLVKYCGASGDFNPQHWNQEYMREAGFDGAIVHGWLTFAHMCRAVRSRIPREVADPAHYLVRYHAVLYPGALSCGGEVVRVGAGEADLILWARNGAGEKVASATMTVRAWADEGNGQ